MGVGLSGRPPSSSRSQAGSPDRSREAEGSQDQSLMARWPSEALVDPSEEGRVVGVGGTWGEASGWVGVRPSSCDCIIMHHHASSCINATAQAVLQVLVLSSFCPCGHLVVLLVGRFPEFLPVKTSSSQARGEKGE